MLDKDVKTKKKKSACFPFVIPSQENTEDLILRGYEELNLGRLSENRLSRK